MGKKEKSYNPAQEQHKKDKKRALDKLKQQRQSTTLSHLSRRNPTTLETQIANLKQIESQGRLPEADKALLLTLEKELKQIYKAKAQFAGTQNAGPTIVSDRTKGREEERDRERQRELKKAFKEAVRGKRDPRRSVYFDEVWNPYGIPPPGMPWKERDEDDSEGWSTDSEVRRIPMPRDTPPTTIRNPKSEQIPERPLIRMKTPPRAVPKPVEKAPEPEPVPVKQGPSETVEEAFLRAGATVIEAAPVLRDFQKEAVKFVPSVVKKRPLQKKGVKKVEEKTDVEEKTNLEDMKTEVEEEEDKDTNDEMSVKKSFVTTVEDEEEDETIPVPQITVDETILRTKPSPVPEPSQSKPVPPQPAATPEPSLKRPLEPEKKQESQPPVAAAPPKRRRMVNAAPDV